MSFNSVSVTFRLYSARPLEGSSSLIWTMTTSPSPSTRSVIKRASAVVIDNAKISTATASPTVASITDDLTGERPKLVSADFIARIEGFRVALLVADGFRRRRSCCRQGRQHAACGDDGP